MSVALQSTPYSNVGLQSLEHEQLFLNLAFQCKKVKTQTEFDLLENSNPQDYGRKKEKCESL